MTWQLRRAGIDDLDAIMRLESGIFGSDAWSTASMRSELRSKNTYYLVAERLDSPGLLDGYAGLLAPAGAREGDIQTIAVAEGARRGGLGRTLVQTLVEEARRRGATAVFLEVRADNPGAQNLYKKLGFVEIAVRPKYYQPDGVDAIVMTLAIAEPKLSPAVGQ
jgi:[ribosomal protein S18]-alanine N-acetyltransferase